MNQSYDRTEEKQSLKKTSRWRKRFAIALLFLLSTIGVGTAVGWYLIQKKLFPLIETELGKYLHRPVDIGELERLSLLSASFGHSTLPKTVDNPDRASIEGVKVNFNLVPLIFTKTLPLKITLIRPDIYIEQDERRIWTPTNFGTGESGEGIKVDVETITFQEADITLVARNLVTKKLNPPVLARFNRGQVELVDDGDIIRFEVTGKLNQGGKLQVTGEAIGHIIELVVDAQELAAKEVENLLALPVAFNQGSVDGKIRVKLSKDPVPELRGTAQLNNVALQIPGLTQAFSRSNGPIGFNGSEIKFNGVATSFGEVQGVIKGSLDIAGEGNYNIEAETKAIEGNKILKALELDSPVPIKGEIAGRITMTGVLNNPVTRFEIVTKTPTRIDKIDFRQIRGTLELKGNNLFVRNFQGIPQSGGKLAGKGTIQLESAQNLFFKVQGDRISSKAIARSYNTKLPIEMGLVSGNATITAQADQPETFRILDGNGSFGLGKGLVTVENLKYGEGIWRSQIIASDVRFDSLPFGKDTTPTIGEGLVNGNFTALGEINDPQLNTLRAQGSATVDTVGGQIIAPQINIASGIWSGDFITSQIKLRQLFPEVPPEFNDRVTGNFFLTGKVSEKPGTETTIKGRGNLQLAQGTVNVSDLKITGNNWNAIATATDLKLKQLNSATPQQFAGLVNGKFDLSGTIDNITPEGIIAQGNGSLTLPEGVFTANNLSISQGNFKTLIIPQGVDLSLFADPNSDDFILTGNLGGELTVTGKVDKIDPTAISATGNVTFSQGIDLLEQPFAADIRWNGARLDVKQATGNELDATGFIQLDPSFFDDIPDKLAAVKYFEFDVTQANWIDINRLKLTLPSWAVNLERSGRFDFSGRISGIPTVMDIDGDLTLRDFVVESLAFADVLQGKVRVDPNSGVKLDISNNSTVEINESLALQQPITENTDQTIQLNLDRNFLPQSFLLQHQDIFVQGTGQQEIVQIKVQDFPLELLKTIATKSPDFTIPPNFATQPLSGKLSGDFTTNLNTLATSGEKVVITSPLFGRIVGTQLEGNFQYAEGYIALQDVKFKQGNSIYQLRGDLIQTEDDINLDGTISVEKGQIQDILVALEIFELTDIGKPLSDRKYGTVEDLFPQSPNSSEFSQLTVGKNQASIWESVKKLSAIQALLESIEQDREKSSFLPELQDLQGNFDGNIKVSGSLVSGIAAEFDFEGQQWQWKKLQQGEKLENNTVADLITVKGDFRNNILTILPITIDFPNLGKTLNNNKEPIHPRMIFTGTFGGEQPKGRLILQSIPIELIEQVVTLPPEVTFGGIIDAEATIAGTQTNPQAKGEMNITDATINQTSIQSTEASFNYNNARLNFNASSVVAQDAEPLTISASVPYQLPFATAKPDSDRITASLNIQDRGLTILDILSRGEINWIDGQGELVLDLSGNFDQATNQPSKLTVKGKAVVENGKIAVKTLPDEFLTEVNSQIDFDLDSISVTSFTGNFGGGKVSAMGTIPLRQDTPQDNPLTIDFDNLAINLKGLYQGGVQGQLQILGIATEPNITGQITLQDGLVLLSDTTTVPQESEPSPDSLLLSEGVSTEPQGLPAVTKYQDLQLRLGDNIQIGQPPIFTFVAEGLLKVNGTFLSPLPEGKIKLKRGQVNLFTTQLNLARGETNTARFTRNNPLDPFLDIHLVGSAIETTQNRITDDPLSTEIQDIPASNFGTLETVRISARVKGEASQIANKLELTSSPPRSQTEILALLGGSFVSTLGRGNSTLGLANLAGSALFGSLNSEFNNTFTIGEIRLFPTQIIDENRDRDRIDALAGEIAIDLTDTFSFSILKILNVANIPAQFGIRYRLNENFVLRGSTNFEDESRTVLEYELRF